MGTRSVLSSDWKSAHSGIACSPVSRYAPTPSVFVRTYTCILPAVAIDSLTGVHSSCVCVWFPCSWVRALLRQEGGPGARAVPAYGRQEVAVLQGGRPGLQVLRAPHAPRPQPFKKACGSAARAPAARPAAAAAAGPRARCWLPEPLAVPVDPHRQRRRRGRWWWWCWWWHVRPGAHLSAAHGQCRCLRDCCRWREQRSQVSLIICFLRLLPRILLFSTSTWC
jgi:hypothetical protein